MKTFTMISSSEKIQNKELAKPVSTGVCCCCCWNDTLRDQHGWD